MFAMVFTTRYLDIVTSFVSLYNSVMKIFFIGSSYATIYLMYSKFRATYDHNHDSFRVEFLVVPMAGLAVLVNHEFSLMEVILEMLEIVIFTMATNLNLITLQCVCIAQNMLLCNVCLSISLLPASLT